MKLVICAVMTYIRLLVMKYILGRNKLIINKRVAFGKNSVLNVEKKASVVFNGQFVTRRNVDITIENDAQFIAGDKVFVNSNCLMSAHKSIIIGDRVQFGPGCMIFDHDHDYRADVDKRNKTFLVEAIEIGSDTWIGANTIILRGSKIGNNCVIGAGCVIKEAIPDNTVYIQKRQKIVFNK